MSFWTDLLALFRRKTRPTPPAPPPATPRVVTVSAWGPDGFVADALAAELTYDDDAVVASIARRLDTGQLQFVLPKVAQYGHQGYLTIVDARGRYARLERSRVVLAPDLNVTLAPAFVPLPRLRARGQFLEQDTGAHWTAIECSDFNLLNRFVEGEDIRPILQQRSALGFNLLRVWLVYDIPRIGRSLPRSALYARIPDFLKACANHDLYVEFTAFTGTGWFASDGAKVDHWERVIDACQSSNNVLLELVNEADNGANAGWGPQGLFQRPSRVMASHGSNVQDSFPVEPLWDYATYRPGGGEWQRKVGHNAMEDVAEKRHIPTISNETIRFPDNEGSHERAFDAAAGAALLCAGSCFHSVRGKTSELWDGLELQCARAWANGARSVPPEFQAGHYIRIEEGKQPNELRVYARVLSDGRACTVRIRA